MCGILVTKEENRGAMIAHRGIEGYMIERDGYYNIHHRLPIQTLPGDFLFQPLRLHNGGLLMFNGEIFNYPKLDYGSDVEYLIELFSELSIDHILHLANSWDGFWSIVFLKDGIYHCFTDPLGKKQLYYNQFGEICSEIRPLVRKQNKKDPIYKSQVFKWGYNTNERTPWLGVSRILPNRLYKFYGGEVIHISHETYFKWGRKPPKLDLKYLLFKAVKERLISKTYGVGSLISGGLDSSIIAYILTELEAPVNYYSIDNGEDETLQILCEHLGIETKYLRYKVDQDLDEIFHWNESPIDLGSVIPQHRLFEVIPEKIVLSGDGADELFGGYRRMKEYDAQMSDIFDELPFYHLPRLDRASMRFTIELRNPFLSHDVVKYAMNLRYGFRRDKRYLRDTFKNDLPREIIEGKKIPLKNPELVEDPIKFRKKVFKHFYHEIF